MATALLVIDVQMAFVADRAAGYAWANPDADQQIATLLAAFRGQNLPVLQKHGRHYLRQIGQHLKN